MVWYCGELVRGRCGCGNGNVAINLARVCADDMAVQVSRQFYGECGFAASGGTGDDDGGATGTGVCISDGFVQRYGLFGR